MRRTRDVAGSNKDVSGLQPRSECGEDTEQARVVLAGRPLADDMRHLDRSERSGETQ